MRLFALGPVAVQSEGTTHQNTWEVSTHPFRLMLNCRTDPGLQLLCLLSPVPLHALSDHTDVTRRSHTFPRPSATFLEKLPLPLPLLVCLPPVPRLFACQHCSARCPVFPQKLQNFLAVLAPFTCMGRRNASRIETNQDVSYLLQLSVINNASLRLLFIEAHRVLACWREGFALQTKGRFQHSL